MHWGSGGSNLAHVRKGNSEKHSKKNKEKMKKLAEAMNQFPHLHLTIVPKTKGKDRKLCKKRANDMLSHITSVHDIPKSRITVADAKVNCVDMSGQLKLK